LKFPKISLFIFLGINDILLLLEVPRTMVMEALEPVCKSCPDYDAPL